MNRREFIALVGSAAAWPLVARAQVERTWRVGWLSLGSGPGVFTRIFIQTMRERGYTEGENLAIEYRWAAGKEEQLEQLAADLVRKQVDLIVTSGSPVTMAAKQATPTIPIVFFAAGAPVEKGLVNSLRQPGGNVTGLALVTDDIKALQILKEVVPGISRVAFVYDPATLPGEFGETWLRRAGARARTLKLDLRPTPLRSAEQVDEVFTKIPIQAVLISIAPRPRMLRSAEAHTYGSCRRGYRGSFLSFEQGRRAIYRPHAAERRSCCR